MARLVRATRWIGVIVLIMAVAGCAGSGPPSQTFTGAGYQAKLFGAGDQLAAPQVRGITVTGERLSLSSYRGHVVVLNFWASWCVACRAEAPVLGTVARKLYPDAVRFIGVDIQDEPDSARAFMQTFRMSYPSLNDPGDEIALDFRNTVPPDALPYTVIINPAGRIAATIIGSTTYDNRMTLISRVVQTR